MHRDLFSLVSGDEDTEAEAVDESTGAREGEAGEELDSGPRTGLSRGEPVGARQGDEAGEAEAEEKGPRATHRWTTHQVR